MTIPRKTSFSSTREMGSFIQQRYGMHLEPGYIPPNWKDMLTVISPRDIRAGDRLLLPHAYKLAVHSLLHTQAEDHLSGPVTWHTDMREFRSGHGTHGEMTVCFTDGDRPAQAHYDFYGIDYNLVHVYRERCEASEVSAAP